MPPVIYLGPVDPNVPTTRYRLPGEDGEDDLLLPVGVEVDASADQAKSLRADGEQMFQIDGKKTASAKKG